MKKDLHPWQWPEEHWRGIVNRVRAASSSTPRCCVPPMPLEEYVTLPGLAFA